LARHTADLDALVGRTLGRRRYEVVARIAQGGMAIVYRGHDRQLDRVVAIKVPRPEFARDRGFSEQFRREARTAARLSHPNVVAVYDSGEERGLPWIVMEHVSGQTLRGLLDAKGRLDPETTAELLGPVADALDHAHHAGIAHLDVKPENVLLASEAVKVADFGLVRAAADQHADLIVVGHSGHSGVWGRFLGSTAEKVSTTPSTMKVAVEPSSNTLGRRVLAASPQPSTASDAPV
jgi:serine/threonine-protein kinase